MIVNHHPIAEQMQLLTDMKIFLKKIQGNVAVFVIEISVTIMKFLFVMLLEISVVLQKTQSKKWEKAGRITRVFSAPTSLVNHMI